MLSGPAGKRLVDYSGTLGDWDWEGFPDGQWVFGYAYGGTQFHAAPDVDYALSVAFSGLPFGDREHHLLVMGGGWK